MDSKKKARLENNNTSLLIQTERRRKLIKEVNNKYRQFTQATMTNIEGFSNKAGILQVKKIEKAEIPISSGLERHHFGTSLYDVYKTNHPSSELGCNLLQGSHFSATTKFQDFSRNLMPFSRYIFALAANLQLQF